MKKSKIIKLTSLLTSSALLIFAVVGLSTDKVALADTSYPSPSVSTTPDVSGVEHEGKSYDAQLGNDYYDIDFGEHEWVSNLNIVSYYEVVNNPVYINAEEGSEKNKIYESLMAAYSIYSTRPVRILNSPVLTDQLARDISGDNSYDAKNFAVSHLFELSLTGDDAACIEWLNSNDYTYLKVSFKMELGGDTAPVIAYRCSDEELAGAERDTSYDEYWSINQTGVISEVDGQKIVTYRFYSLCPMFMIQTSPVTNEIANHPEWEELYPSVAGFNTTVFIIPLIIIFTGAVCAAGSIAYVLSSKKKDN